ncbi:MAG: outer membrane receptor for ferrienterochelin and colicins [Paraglaciecola sp.]|jgi:outer membrane receptor for ferrienterochelin and colicins
MQNWRLWKLAIGDKSIHFSNFQNSRTMLRLILCTIVFIHLLPFAKGQEGSFSETELDSLWKTIDLNDVVVTAQYAPTDSKNALQSIRVINRETIEKQGANNLEQLLQQDLSICIQQDLVLGSSLKLLGTDGENIKIMVDGVPVIGRLDGSIDLSQINLNNVERIEIIEGPMSVAYGTDALGGVINLITKKNQLNTFELNLNQQLETRSETVSTIDGGIRFKNKLLLRANLGRDKFTGFSNDTLRASLWNPKEQWYGNVSLRYDFANDHRIMYQGGYFTEEVKNLGEIRRPIFKPYAFDDVYKTRRMNHALSHEGKVLQKFYWQNTLGYNDFDRETSTDRIDIEKDSSWILSSDTTRFDAWMARSVIGSQFLNSKVNFQLGIDFRQEKGAGDRILDDTNDPSNESSIGDYAIFGSLRYQPIKNLLTEIGLRAAHNTRYDAPLIPSFNLKYQVLENLTARASYAKGFRSPSLKELYISFIDINHFIVGNPNLKAENSHNFQVNLNYQEEWTNHKIKIRTNLFYNDIQDQIGLFTFVEREDGSYEPISPNQSSQYAYFNIENAKIRGLNVNTSYQWRDLSIEAGVSRLYQFNPLSEEYATVDQFTPTTEINGKITYQVPVVQTNISLFYRNNDRLINYYPTLNDEGKTIAAQIITDGFSILDATFLQRLFNNRLQITAGIRNLLDVQQVNITGAGGSAHTGSGGLPIGTGRSYFVKVGYKLF